jgi:site-specific recombinase XerD
MRLNPAEARQLLVRVDPGLVQYGVPVGLRDGALLALVAAGLSAVEIARLRATRVRQIRGRLIVVVTRYEVAWSAVLPVQLGARVLAWLSESRLWAEDKPIFPGLRGPLTPVGVCKVIDHYAKEAHHG